MSSSTEPFQPAERKYRVTQSVLEAMVDRPPDGLIVQTHSHTVTEYLKLYRELARRMELRFHVSIESDVDRLPGLPSSGSTVEKRVEACRQLRAAGLSTVVTVSPLLPIRDPEGFFARLSAVADAIVLDHFIDGDGSANGSRTMRTRLPAAMAEVDASSVTLEYRDRMVELARRYFPGRVGVNIDGFAGKYQ
jgi:DNA repair photolyase